MLESLPLKEQANLLMTVGKHRKSRPITPVQVGQLLHKTIPKDQTISATADCLGLRDTSMLRKFMDLINLPADVWPFITWGSKEGYLSFSSAALIAKVESRDDVNTLAKAAINHQLTKEEIRSIIQRIKRGKADNVSAAQAIKEIVNLRPTIVYQHMYYGDLPDRLLASHGQKDMQQAIRRGLAKLFNPEDILAVKVINGKFAFTLNQNALDGNPQLGKSLSTNKVEGFVASIAKQNLEN